MAREPTPGKIVRVSGPVVVAANLPFARLHDVVLVGREKLVGEIIRLTHKTATIQVYEETSGLSLEEPVFPTGSPLYVELGPGLLGNVYDGLQRPLIAMLQEQGAFLSRGLQTGHLDPQKKWVFKPAVEKGASVKEGQALGFIQEENQLRHFILLPPGIEGELLDIAEGQFTIKDIVATVVSADHHANKITMAHRWPVRKPRPRKKQIPPRYPLLTGTRVIDLFFPIARGGSAIIPGGFGTGKTVTQQSLSRWADVDVVVYVGCGERGNEMAEVLNEFPLLEDPRNGKPLISRTVLIANTSNMPVAAREASIYTGMTIAEYFRDMGYDVLLLADSTSRWAEALREISGRLEEIPGEEGYPAYMSTRLATYYERTGNIELIHTNAQAGQRTSGSVSLVGAISPPGADFSEPVTQDSMRVAGAYWALDYELSRQRHFPAINWLQSYSLYHFDDWYKKNLADDFADLIHELKSILREEDALKQIVQIIGQESLSEPERLLLFISRLIREDLLQQSALDPIDRFSPLEKDYWMIKIIMLFYQQAKEALTQEWNVDAVANHILIPELAVMKNQPVGEAVEQLKLLYQKIDNDFFNLLETGGENV